MTLSRAVERRGRRDFAMLGLVAVVVLGGHASACSCGDVRVRPDSGGVDAIVIVDAAMSADHGSLDGSRDAAADLDQPDITDAAADVSRDGDANALDAAHDAYSRDATTDADAASDATVDASGDAGQDSGCLPGLSACPDPDGTIRCVDLLSDHCNCHRCGQACLCFEGVCSDCGGSPVEALCGPAVCRPGDRFGCHFRLTDPLHCGGCYNACAADEDCVGGVCSPRSDGGQ